MALYDAIAATTAATGSGTPRVRYDGSVYAVPIPFENTQVLSLVADALGTGEAVNIYVWGGSSWTVVADQDETAIQLTDGKKADAFQAGLEYGVSKTETVAPCAVRYAYAPRQY